MRKVWVAFTRDWNITTFAVFQSEAEARRWAMENYGNVKEVEWGEEVS